MAMNDELDQLLACDKVTDEDWEALYEILGMTSAPLGRLRRKVLNEEIRHNYGHTLINWLARNEYEPDYIDILKGTAEKMGVAVKDHHTVAEIEDKVIVEAIDKMKAKIIEEKGIDEWKRVEGEIDTEVEKMAAEGKFDQGVTSELEKYKGTAVMAALLGGRLADVALYQVATQSFIAISRALGLRTGVITPGQIIGPSLAFLLGPAGLVIGGGWLAGSTNWKKTIPSVLTVVIYRRKYELPELEEAELNQHQNRSGAMQKGTDPIYKNSDALNPVEKLVEEASAAVQEPSRVASKDAEINEALALAGGIGTGGTIGFAALYYAGATGLSAVGITTALAAAGTLVGGGMTAGIAVIAAPAVLIGVGAYAWAAQRNKKQLIDKKEMLLQEVLKKHNAVISELQKTSESNKDRINYLTSLNTLLQAAISDLNGDLALHNA